MRLQTLELNGFKSFAQKTVLEFESPIVGVVGPNGSGKSNVVEAFRYVLGEQSMKSMRGRSGSDLVFKGSKSLPKGSRAKVSIHFNNSDKVFKLDQGEGAGLDLNYDVVSISREVFLDGLNKYSLNGTDIRLKDIHNLLASVNIGASGHHIISQGEADRILNASSKDRKEMIEDALGLKIYQYKIKESERKLEKTENNMREVGLLRRENAPHLNFLKRQVEKFEKGKEMEIELSALYRDYFQRENYYIQGEQYRLKNRKNELTEELQIITGKISDRGPMGSPKDSENQKIEELKTVEQKLNELRAQKGELVRKLGRTEGMLEAKESRVEVSGRCPTCGKELREEGDESNRLHIQNELQELHSTKTALLASIEELKNQEAGLLGQVVSLKESLSKEIEALRDLERERFSLKVKQQELSSALDLIVIEETNLKNRIDALEYETKEAVALVGSSILAFTAPQAGQEARPAPLEQADISLEDLKRKIERLKIKLEDAGLSGGAELLKEFEQVKERDEFLVKEINDLTKSIESLQALISDLREKIDLEFKEGIKKINVEFQEFFSLMFGGGTGVLSVVVENKKKRRDEDAGQGGESQDIAFEQGIEINVSLPHKKVKELHALSGGERSLTSIALLFAMSQVNPPPFLVLDETDAALDEANSRKYGDMLEKLSKHSQLVVVTHNRETMSRAGMLYGVTIGANGASKLLSVKLDEAVSIAK